MLELNLSVDLPVVQLMHVHGTTHALGRYVCGSNAASRQHQRTNRSVRDV
jgi:hypothetical protein